MIDEIKAVDTQERGIILSYSTNGGILIPLELIDIISKLQVVEYEGYSKAKIKYSTSDVGAQIVKLSNILPMDPPDPVTV
jgi:hypothetical protein